MKATMKIAILMMMALSTLFVAVGCRVSEVDVESSLIVEDQPSELMLNLEQRNFSTVATRAIANESEIHCLALFVFNSEGKLVTRSFIDPSSLAQIKLRTTSGRDMRVVAVANYKSIDGLEEQLAIASNYDVLTDVVITKSATSPGTSAGILMTGETTADISNSQSINHISVTMQYAVAKVTLSIKVPGAALAEGESLEIFNLALGSIPTQGFLLQNSDEPASRSYESLESLEFTANEAQEITATYYVLENLRGGRTQIAPPAGLAENGGNGHMFKRHYAPENSSYAVISANHRQNGTLIKRVDMYVYFGRNSSDNYDIARSENHTYSIRINGLNNINVDTNIEATDYDLTLGYGDNLNMDSHADLRSLKFGKNASGVVTVEVVDESGRRVGDAGFNATWLKVSPLDLMKHQVRLTNNGAKSRWQQAGEPYSLVRGKHIPHKSVRATLPNGGWNAVPSGLEDDDRMAYDDATYRMCYAITDIKLTENREIVIYSDENTTGKSRLATIEIRYTNASGAPQVKTLPMTQTSMYEVGTGNGHTMLIESFEEYSFNVYATPDKQLTKRGGMHWGFYNNPIYQGMDASGDFLTANAVYGDQEKYWKINDRRFVQYDEKGLPTWSSTIEYRTKYGADDITYKWDSFYGKTTAPYYYPNYDSQFEAYAPIYNSSAARYCHEKNRDVNGDGEISPNEAHWFLPSAAEMAVIGSSIDKLPVSARPDMSRGASYWTSTEHSNTDIAYGYDFSLQSVSKYKKNTVNRVRCVRRGEKVAHQDIYVDGNGSVVVDNNGLDSELITNTIKSKVPATESSDELISSKFVIARSDVSSDKTNWCIAAGFSSHYLPLQLGDNAFPNASTGCAAYSELPGGSDKGHWRLPTRKELVRIVTLKSKLGEVAGYTPMLNTWYWSVTEKANFNMYNSWAVNVERNNDIDMMRQSLCLARCIRQI